KRRRGRGSAGPAAPRRNGAQGALRSMSLRRRQFLQLAAGALALPPAARIARAQAYPARPVRIVVGVPAGGTFDIVARLIGQWLSERLRPQVIIQKPAGGGYQGAPHIVGHAAAGGHTLVVARPPGGTQSAPYRKPQFQFI